VIPLVVLTVVTLHWTVPAFLSDTVECGPPTIVPLRDASRCAVIGWARNAAAPETLALVAARGKEGQQLSAAFDDRGLEWTCWAITFRDGGPPACHGNEKRLNMASTGVPGASDRLSLGPVIPQPAQRRATVQFTLPVSGPAELELFDLGGRRIATIIRATLAAGPHLSLFGVAELSPGVYILRLQSSGERRLLRFVVIR
jgi:hypothetical protein